MTGPLIDRDALVQVIVDYYDDDSGKEQVLADALIAYLRTVITPEALAPETTHDGWREVDMPEGRRLYRAIFGNGQ